MLISSTTVFTDIQAVIYLFCVDIYTFITHSFYCGVNKQRVRGCFFGGGGGPDNRTYVKMAALVIFHPKIKPMTIEPSYMHK